MPGHWTKGVRRTFHFGISIPPTRGIFAIPRKGFRQKQAGEAKNVLTELGPAQIEKRLCVSTAACKRARTHCPTKCLYNWRHTEYEPHSPRVQLPSMVPRAGESTTCAQICMATSRYLLPPWHHAGLVVRTLITSDFVGIPTFYKENLI